MCYWDRFSIQGFDGDFNCSRFPFFPPNCFPFPPCPIPVCSAPFTGIATNITISTALITGNIICQGSGLITEAGVEYATNPCLTGSFDALGTVTQQFSVTLSSLLPGTTYYYRAFVVAEGNRCVGRIRSFTTSAAALVVTGNAVSVLTTSALIQGSAYSGLPAMPTEVGVEYSTSPVFTGVTVVPALLPVTPFDVQLFNLFGLTTYYYRAYAVSNGSRYLGDIKSFTTAGIII